MSRPGPPSSTLFPYTTLFRSGRSHHRQAGGPEHLPAQPAQGRHRHRAEYQVEPLLTCCHFRSGMREKGDRKSTRLNSSHVKISYAVFCLKKKKNERLNVEKKY